MKDPYKDIEKQAFRPSHQTLYLQATKSQIQIVNKKRKEQVEKNFGLLNLLQQFYKSFQEWA